LSTAVLVEEELKEAAECGEECAVAENTQVYYGWLMLALAMTAFIGTSPGQTFGVSIFNESMRNSLGLTHGQLSAAYTLGTLAAALPLGYVGALADRHGLRRMMFAVVFLFGLACFATALAVGPVSLFASFAVLRLLGPGALAMLCGNTLAFWFQRRLGFVEGVRHVGMAGAMAAIPPINLWLLQTFGWRGAYAVMGTAVWATLLPLVYGWYRERPADVGQVIDGCSAKEEHNAPATFDAMESLTLQQALRTRSFWIVSAGTAAFGLIHTAVFFCIVPIFLDRGLTAQDASGMLTAYAMALAATQLVGGALADCIRPVFLLPASVALLSFSMIALAQLTSVSSGYVCGALMGASQGFYFATSNPLWARYFGRLHLGKIRGTLSMLNVGASSIGPFACGFSRDLLGRYDHIVIAFAILPVPIMAAGFLAAPPERPDSNDDPVETNGNDRR
jgi:MFS transporter, OFA family, oxalate/formate antiporter